MRSGNEASEALTGDRGPTHSLQMLIEMLPKLSSNFPKAAVNAKVLDKGFRC